METAIFSLVNQTRDGKGEIYLLVVVTREPEKIYPALRAQLNFSDGVKGEEKDYGRYAR